MYVFYWQRHGFKGWGFLAILGLLLLLGFTCWRWFGRAAVPAMKTQPIYQGDPERKAIALTFTIDWGEEYLPAILTALEKVGARATFFPTGQWAERHPELVRQMAAAGHEIGNHGQSHPHPDNLSREENRQDILQGEATLKAITGKKPVLYSPPYGESKPQVVAAASDLGYKFIMWTINTGDYLPNTQPEDILATILPKCQNGAIVLLHPTEPAAKALPELLQQLKERGYALVTTSEILPNG
ncbi:peptidoglycan-N-acetylglucosamine deacetylase [Moorella thermoacetica]|uniref:Peptidoglycan-N-acetylglucosamine deacetylase n=1 Tax=Neomoorella thermoacetica TaxID=1525 RepID=A0A1J5JI30_NEOTH|nr:polysaccharide deacetylase family protein [Moorella thermoacetica]OIQ08837.1 peptidoglycan-N-acetylglucosamine deacetylase [Moorella thermoacetica]